MINLVNAQAIIINFFSSRSSFYFKVRQLDGTVVGGIEVVPTQLGLKILGAPLGSDAF